MAEFMTGLKRSHYCGDLRITDVGSEVTVCGWVQRQRDLGQLIFIDLRDRTGIVQLAFNNSTDKEIFEKAFSARSEYVLCAKGIVRERSSKTDKVATGDIEIEVTDLRVLSKAHTPPFEIVDDCKTSEDIRLKYRYLDLRRKPLFDNLYMRSKIAKVARDYFYENGFIEIETPMLIMLILTQIIFGVFHHLIDGDHTLGNQVHTLNFCSRGNIAHFKVKTCL